MRRDGWGRTGLGTGRLLAAFELNPASIRSVRIAVRSPERRLARRSGRTEAATRRTGKTTGTSRKSADNRTVVKPKRQTPGCLTWGLPSPLEEPSPWSTTVDLPSPLERSGCMTLHQSYAGDAGENRQESCRTMTVFMRRTALILAVPSQNRTETYDLPPSYVKKLRPARRGSRGGTNCRPTSKIARRRDIRGLQLPKP
jgi:hypothetical protein